MRHSALETDVFIANVAGSCNHLVAVRVIPALYCIECNNVEYYRVVVCFRMAAEASGSLCVVEIAIAEETVLDCLTHGCV